MRGFFEQLVGPESAGPVMWVAIALIVLVAGLIALRILRGMTSGTFVMGGRNRKTRLAVMDATAVDANRRLVLVRRDDVEHLILIGGPTDVVVEQNIHAFGAPRRAEPTAPAPAPIEPQSPAIRPAPRPDPAPVPSHDVMVAAAEVPPAPRPASPPPAMPAPVRRPEPPMPSAPPVSARPAALSPMAAPAAPASRSDARPVHPAPAPQRERSDPSAVRAIPTVTRGPAAMVGQARDPIQAEPARAESVQPERREPVLDAPEPASKGIQSGHGPVLSAYRVQKGGADQGWVMKTSDAAVSADRDTRVALDQDERRRDEPRAQPVQQPNPADQRDPDEIALEEEMNRLLGDLSDSGR